MRSGFLLVSATCVLVSAPSRADEFKNPPVIAVRSPGGDLTIRARQGTASVPGLGDVERVYGYEVRRGTESGEAEWVAVGEIGQAKRPPADPTGWQCRFPGRF